MSTRGAKFAGALFFKSKESEAVSALDKLISMASRKSPMMGHGNKNARIMVIQESPYQAEWKRKEYMGGKGGRMFKAALGEVGISVDDIYFTSIVKYPTPDDRLPLPEEVRESRELLLAEIDVVNPEIIIPTGNMSMKAVTGKTGITKLRGQFQETKEGLRCFPMIHPNMVLKNPGYMEYFSKDMINLSAILSGETPEGVEAIEKTRRYCETFKDAIDEVNRLIDLPAGSRIVVDLETIKSNPFIPRVESNITTARNFPDSLIPKIVAIGFSDRAGYGSAIPLYHRQTPFPGNVIGTIVKTLRVLFSRKDVEFVAHNGKFELKWLLRQLDIYCDNMVWDTMVMHYLAITEEKGTHDLSQLAWLETDMGGYDSKLDKVAPKGLDKGNYDLIDWDILKVYLADDCDVSYRLLDKYRPIIENNKDMSWLWDNIMLPGYYTLLDIEVDGIKVDREHLNLLKEEYPKEIKRIEDKLRQYPEVLEIERENMERWRERVAIGQIQKRDRTPEQQEKFNKWKRYDPNGKDGDGTKMNFGSSAQLSELLFNRMGLETVVFTEKGNPSTNADSLIYMKDQHDIIPLLMEYAKVKHLESNFVSGLEAMLDMDDIVHPNYNIHGTVTGRLSSNEPNAQQIPRIAYDPFSFQYNYEIKKLFTTRFEDGIIMQLDYSQLELRILGVISKDPELIKRYRTGSDLHKITASGAFGIPVEEVTSELRTAAKKIAFGIIYQESPRGLSEDLRSEGIDMSEEECARFIENYLSSYPEVRRWISNTKRKVRREKIAVSMTNRVRHLPDIDSNDRSKANEALRQSVNFPIQSTGSDCTMQALIQINKWLKETGKRSRIVITVHDSIVIDSPKSEAIEVARKAKHIMENLAEYNEFYSFLGDVPIVADLEVGYNYGEIHELDDLTIDDLEEIGITNFIDQQNAKKRQKELDAYKKAEEEGRDIPRYVRGYWEVSA